MKPLNLDALKHESEEAIDTATYLNLLLEKVKKTESARELEEIEVITACFDIDCFSFGGIASARKLVDWINEFAIDKLENTANKKNIEKLNAKISEYETNERDQSDCMEFLKQSLNDVKKMNSIAEIELLITKVSNCDIEILFTRNREKVNAMKQAVFAAARDRLAYIDGLEELESLKKAMAKTKREKALEIMKTGTLAERFRAFEVLKKNGSREKLSDEDADAIASTLAELAYERNRMNVSMVEAYDIQEMMLNEEITAKQAILEYRYGINARAICDMIDNGIDEYTAKKLIDLVASGKISNIDIKY